MEYAELLALFTESRVSLCPGRLTPDLEVFGGARPGLCPPVLEAPEVQGKLGLIGGESREPLFPASGVGSLRSRPGARGGRIGFPSLVSVGVSIGGEWADGEVEAMISSPLGEEEEDEEWPFVEIRRSKRPEKVGPPLRAESVIPLNRGAPPNREEESLVDDRRDTGTEALLPLGGGSIESVFACGAAPAVMDESGRRPAPTISAIEDWEA